MVAKQNYRKRNELIHQAGSRQIYSQLEINLPRSWDHLRC